MLQITGQASVLERQPQLLASLRLRDPYIDPMSYFQVRLLRERLALPGVEIDSVDSVVIKEMEE